jgi:hypothetical protein
MGTVLVFDRQRHQRQRLAGRADPSVANQGAIPQARFGAGVPVRRNDTVALGPTSKRVETAAEFCGDVAFDGWADAVVGRIADCIDAKTWNRMFGRRRQGDCKVLADLARSILDGKKQLHELVRSSARGVTRLFGGGDIEATVASELSQHIHIPVVDEKPSLSPALYR